MKPTQRRIAALAAGLALAFSLGLPATASADGGRHGGGQRWEHSHHRSAWERPGHHRQGHHKQWKHGHRGHGWGHHKHFRHGHGRPVYVVPHREVHVQHAPRVVYPSRDNEVTIIYRGVFD